MASEPSGSSMTTGFFVAVSVLRIAALGGGIIGTLMNDPKGPGLVIENVKPVRSSGPSLFALASTATERIERARPRSVIESASGMFATIRPF